MADSQSQYSEFIAGLASDAKMAPGEFVSVVKQRCFKDGSASNAQLMLLLLIAKKYDLNPLVRELHAFINPKGGQMEIAVGIDGWIKIVTRHPRFRGYAPTEIHDDQGVLVAIKMQMHRDDWSVPGTYTAQMSEWFVPHEANKGPSNWEKYPSHRLFAKAFQECARFTFGITEIVDEDDAIRIERAEEPIRQPMAAQPKALEHQPLEAMPIMPGAPREAVPVGEREHLKVKLDEVQAQAGAEVAAESAVAPSQDGTSAPSENAPAAPPPAETKKRKRAADPVAAQTAAGLEVIDPNERPLETFLRAHDVPATRINLQLAKHGVAKLTDLSAEQEAQVLAVLERSIR